MTWLQICMALVKPFEGCARRLHGLIWPYLDKLAKPPVWTRGYGRTYGITGESPAITEKEAEDELAVGLMKYGGRCLAMAPALADKPPCMAAVTSWAWNCGTGAFKVSRLRRAINEARWYDALQYIRTPRTAGGVEYRGLARRRDTEAGVFVQGLA